MQRRGSQFARYRTFRPAWVLLAAIFLCAAPAVLRAQEVTEPPSEEIVANLAAGRVVIAVVKDAIIVATVENPIESQTHPPIPVELNSRRVGVLLGAIDWFSPSSEVQVARLDKELPHLRANVLTANPQSESGPAPNEATDLESVGQGVLLRLNHVASSLHEKVDWPADEPVVQLILAGFVPNYGPEVWQLTFGLTQEMRKLDYYDTHVTRPVYLQFWPPEKNQLHSLIEFQYPPAAKSPTLLELLRNKDPRVEKICDSDARMKEVAEKFLQGDYKKILPADATQFLRAALAAIAPPHARQTMAIVNFDSGFEWVLRPPPEPKSTTPQETQKDRPADAPSLLGPPSSQ